MKISLTQKSTTLLKDRKFADLATGNYVALGKYKALEDEKNDLNTKYLANLRTKKSERQKSQNVKSILSNLKEEQHQRVCKRNFLTLLTKKTRLEIAELFLADGKI